MAQLEKGKRTEWNAEDIKTIAEKMENSSKINEAINEFNFWVRGARSEKKEEKDIVALMKKAGFENDAIKELAKGCLDIDKVMCALQEEDEKQEKHEEKNDIDVKAGELIRNIRKNNADCCKEDVIRFFSDNTSNYELCKKVWDTYLKRRSQLIVGPAEIEVYRAFNDVCRANKKEIDKENLKFVEKDVTKFAGDKGKWTCFTWELVNKTIEITSAKDAEIIVGKNPAMIRYCDKDIASNKKVIKAASESLVKNIESLGGHIAKLEDQRNKAESDEKKTKIDSSIASTKGKYDEIFKLLEDYSTLKTEDVVKAILMQDPLLISNKTLDGVKDKKTIVKVVREALCDGIKKGTIKYDDIKEKAPAFLNNGEVAIELVRQDFFNYEKLDEKNRNNWGITKAAQNGAIKAIEDGKLTVDAAIENMSSLFVNEKVMKAFVEAKLLPEAALLEIKDMKAKQAETKQAETKQAETKQAEKDNLEEGADKKDMFKCSTKEDAIKIVSENGFDFDKLPDKFKKDPEVIKAAEDYIDGIIDRFVNSNTYIEELKISASDIAKNYDWSNDEFREKLVEAYKKKAKADLDNDLGELFAGDEFYEAALQKVETICNKFAENLKKAGICQQNEKRFVEAVETYYEKLAEKQAEEATKTKEANTEKEKVKKGNKKDKDADNTSSNKSQKAIKYLDEENQTESNPREETKASRSWQNMAVKLGVKNRESANRDDKKESKENVDKKSVKDKLQGLGKVIKEKNRQVKTAADSGKTEKEKLKKQKAAAENLNKKYVEIDL